MYVYEKFTVDRLIVYPSLENVGQNVVAGAQWSIIFEDFVNTEVRFTVVTPFTLPTQNIIPYENLTEEIIKQWVYETLGNTKINDLRSMFLNDFVNMRESDVTTTVTPEWN